MRRPLRLGAAIVVLYTVVALATGSWAPGRLRPLFDGFASHEGSYGWVKPPKEFAKRNRPPDSGQARITFGAEGSAPADAETPDGQVMASIPAGAVPRHPFDAAARLEVRPLDSTALGPLPAGLRPEANAYQVTIAFLPTGDLVPTLAVPGTVGLTAAAPADTLLFAADGRTWREVEAKPLNRANALTGPLSQTGYYLAASHAAPRSTGSSGGGAPLGLFVVAAAIPLILGYLLLGRRRLAERSSTGRSATTSRGTKQKATPKGKTAPRKAGPAAKATSKAKTGRATEKAPTETAPPSREPGTTGKATAKGKPAPKEEVAPKDKVKPKDKVAPTDKGAPTDEPATTKAGTTEGRATKPGTATGPATEGRWPLAPGPEGEPGSEREAAPERPPAPEEGWPLAPASPGGEAPTPPAGAASAAPGPEGATPDGEAAAGVEQAPAGEADAPGDKPDPDGRAEGR